jgi:hypothetical protein
MRWEGPNSLEVGQMSTQIRLYYFLYKLWQFSQFLSRHELQDDSQLYHVDVHVRG